MVPLQNIGTLTLNRNPVDYFTEVEEVAFCTQHIVPGMDFTSDPLLQGRNFSYFDTQITRLGINFSDIPVNRPVCPFATNLQDGHMAMASKKNRTRYHPNRHDALPLTAPKAGGFHSYAEAMSGIKERMHGPKFNEFVNQAQLFYNSMSEAEKQHIVSAAQFELSKCFEPEVQQAAVERFNLVNHDFAQQVASVMPQVKVPAPAKYHNQKSAFLSQVNGKNQTFTAEGRKLGVYIVEGFDHASIAPLAKAFEAAGMMVKYVGPVGGAVKSATGESVEAEFTFENSRSTHFDAILFVGSPSSPQQAADAYVKSFKMGRLVHAAREAYMHKKTIGATGNLVKWLSTMCLPGDVGMATGDSVVVENGVVLAESVGTGAEFGKKFMDGVAQHRCWERDVSHIAA